MVQISHPNMTTGKSIALTVWTFVSNVLSLLLNTLSRLVIAFLPRSKHLLLSWLQLTSSMFLEPKKIKSVTVSTFSPSICHEVMGQRPWSEFSEHWVLSQPFHSLFHPRKRFFSSSSLSVTREVLSAYLRLLVFLLAILIPTCDSSNLNLTWCTLHIS